MGSEERGESWEEGGQVEREGAKWGERGGGAVSGECFHRGGQTEYLD